MTRPEPRSRRRRGRFVLVDGVDLAGKTTLVNALVEELSTRGVPAVRHRGMLAAHHPLEKALRQLSSARQPDSWWTTAAYLWGGFALDALLVRWDEPHPPGAVIIQDGYVDRTAAFGIAGAPTSRLAWPCAALACSRGSISLFI